MFDVLSIAAIADEIGAELLDGRIQRLGLIDPRTIAFEVYASGRRRTVVASADQARARLFIARSMPSIDSELITPFGLLLRKYVRGGLLVGIGQPPLERLVRLSIAKRLTLHNERRTAGNDEPEPEDDDGEGEDPDGERQATHVHLFIEIMGRHSNLILVDDEGRIMESAKRVTPAMSRVRPIWPRLTYTDPPPVDKLDPRRLTADGASVILKEGPASTAVASLLVRAFRGVSPQMAREIAFRVAGDSAVLLADLEPDAAVALARETRAHFEPLLTSAWAPRVYRDDDVVVAFAPVPFASLAAAFAEEAVPSISAAAEAATDVEPEHLPARHAQRRERLLQAIGHVRERQDRRLASIRQQQAGAAEAERLRDWGERIYAYLWQIRPGDSELVADDMKVPLDPSLDGKANAQAYFERYRKARSAGEHLPALEGEVRAELAYLDQLRIMVEQAEGFAAIEALTAEWEARGGSSELDRTRSPRRRPAERRPRPLLDDQGNAVFIGRSGAQNDLVTFDIAGANDTWLHARGVPGSHVIIRWRQPSGEEVSQTIEAAARLAAYYSASRSGTSVEVDVTRRRYVRKIKGSGPGMVTYRNERTMAVRPADDAELIDVLAPAPS